MSTTPDLARSLQPEQLAFFQENGYLHLRHWFSPTRVEELRSWAQELMDWPETPGKWMKYFESTPTLARQLCRVENFLTYHEGWAALLCGDSITSLVSALMDEPAVLYKEKMNVKLPGGAGFGAHQDAPAFTTFGQTYHITLMLSIDPSFPDNGCLEMVPAKHNMGLFAQAPGGTLADEVIDAMEWVPLPTEAGDLVLFDSYIPHRSQTNHSESPRRAMYITYNRASEGSYRDAYFAHKREHFPPECERVEGADYSRSASLYNLGNPIR